MLLKSSIEKSAQPLAFARGSGRVSAVFVVRVMLCMLESRTSKDKVIPCWEIWVDGGVFAATSTQLSIGEAAGFFSFFPLPTNMHELNRKLNCPRV